MNKPLLLLTNDDGIHASGLHQLWEILHEEMDLVIVAPHHEKSGCGVSITWSKPLQLRENSWNKGTPAWSLNGTPADCVKMGLGVLLDRTPDLIVSGINQGSNAGRTVLYSGTVGGVIEGALKGIPGVAFSFSDLEDPPLSISKPHVRSIVKQLLQKPLPTGTLLNVNFPKNAKEGIKGLRFARQGLGRWVEQPDRRIHPEGIPYYWLGGRWDVHDEHPNSDIALLAQGYITAVPIRISDLTDESALQNLGDFP